LKRKKGRKKNRNGINVKWTFFALYFEHLYSPFSSLDSSLTVADDERFGWFLR